MRKKSMQPLMKTSIISVKKPNKIATFSLIISLVAAISLPQVNAQTSDNDIERISVSGSQYTLMESVSGINNYLSKESIDRMPHMADDVFRIMPSLPGVSAGDFSANFFVRGGESDEVLVLLDGMQLYRPFHMKSFNGAFSIIDTENVGRIEFSSGGYSAQFGNKMSGVLDITSLIPAEESKTSVGASFINARAGSQGSFDNDRGFWLVSARRGYIDLILAAMDDEATKFEPTFGDVYAKVGYEIHEQHMLSMSLLYAYDDEILDDTFMDNNIEIKEKIAGKYDSSYLWLKLNSQWSDTLSSDTLVSIGKITEDRHGGEYDPLEIWLSLRDEKEFSVLQFKQDWQWRVSDDQLLQLGLNTKYLDAKYDYKMQVWYINNYHDDNANIDNINTTDYLWRNTGIKSKGNEIGLYVNHKFRFNDKLVSEVGLRWDKQDYMGFDDDQMSPRASLAYSLSPATQLRFSWGHYYQAQDILDLQVADGVTNFVKAQKAEHRIIGLDTVLFQGEGYQDQAYKDINLRVEVYQKLLSSLKRRYENAFDRYEFFPEGQADRQLIAPQSAEITGVELSLHQQFNDKFYWSASYVWSEATDEIDGKDYLRNWDQTHAVNLSINYLMDNGWNINAAYSYHSGWPITGEYGTTELQSDGNYQLTKHIGERNQQALKSYNRIDFRASKTYQLNDSVLTWFFEVTNLLNTDNECCIDQSFYEVNNNGVVTVVQERGSWLPMIPSLGLKWQF